MIPSEDFIWDVFKDCYICPNGSELTFRGRWFKKGVPLRTYVSDLSECKNCELRPRCFTERSKGRKICRRIGQEAQEAGYRRIGTHLYKEILQKRQIVCEGNFGLQKRCHNLRFTRKRGIENVEEQCLLSASALNLKRLIKGITGKKNPLAKAAKDLMQADSLFFIGCFQPAILLTPTLSTDPGCQRFLALFCSHAKSGLSAALPEVHFSELVYSDRVQVAEPDLAYSPFGNSTEKFPPAGGIGDWGLPQQAVF